MMQHREQPNIILITADSLRADHLSCYGYPKPTSPHLDKLAQSCLFFPQAFSNGPNTPHAFPAILAGQEALRSQKLGLFDAPVTLAETLKAHGYQTFGFNAANPYVSASFHYHRGFDEFHDFLDFDIFPTKNPGEYSFRNASSEAVTIPILDLEHYVLSEDSVKRKAALEGRFNYDIFETLRNRAHSPFFIWIHYMDTHYPYLPQRISQLELGFEAISKEENLALNTHVRENLGGSSEFLKRLTQLYDASIRQLDMKISAVVDVLRKMDLFESSLLIFTADHGEEFLEHGDLQHRSKLYDELLRVPLLIKFPFQTHSGVHRRLVSLVQLAPTILSLVGSQNPFCVPGFLEPLLEDDNPIFASAHYVVDNMPPTDSALLKTNPLPKVHGCRERRWKLINDTEKKTWSLYDLVQDPFETKDVFKENRAKAQSLKSRLESHVFELEKSRMQLQILPVKKGWPQPK